METYTITEDCHLPSNGKIYGTPVKADFKIRSMTTEEEMKRLGHSDRPNELLAEIIDDCILDKLGIKAYDLCTGDYQYLVHRLRVATYGPDYKITTICPVCGASNNDTINLDTLEVFNYSDDLDKYVNITLPKTKKQIELRMQTPRMLDSVALRVKEQRAKNPNSKSDSAFLFTLSELIYKVDGEVINKFDLEKLVRSLPMADANYILQCAKKIDEKIGINSSIPCSCSSCGAKYNSAFPFTGEFFGPTID